MDENFTITCGKIEENLKPFLEDMLKEEEYQAFLGHLEECPKCKKHVTSVDSFSNQLWKLGDVKVPADFCSTVLFKLTQPEPEPEPEPTPGPESKPSESKSSLSKTLLVGGLVFIFIATTVFFGIKFFKTYQSSQEKVKITRAPAAVGDQWVELPFDNFSEDAAELDVPGKGDVAKEDFSIEEMVSGVNYEEAAFDEDQLIDAQPRFLHWHFVRSNETEEAEVLRLKKDKSSTGTKLRRGTKEQERLKTEIERLKERVIEMEFERLSSEGPDQVKLDEEKVQIEAELKQLAEQGKEQNSIVKNLEEKSLQIEAQLKQITQEKMLKKREPLNALKTLGIELDYQDSDFLLFSATGGSLDSMREQMALISQKRSPLQEFTPVTSSLANNPYRVSVYIEKLKSSVHHWHVRLSQPNQKTQLLGIIQKKGGIINYEAQEEITFSIANREIEDLKAQMPVMRIRLSEFGPLALKEVEPNDEQAIISLYFAK